MSEKTLIYLLIVAVVIMFLVNNLWSNRNENFKNETLYKLPNQLTTK